MEYNDDDSYSHMVDQDKPEIQEENEKKKLINEGDKTQNTVKLTRCRGCTFYMEPLLFISVLAYFPLFILLPQYVTGREMDKLTGNHNITINTNSCHGDPSHNSSTPDNNDPIMGNYTLAQSAASMFMLQYSLVSSIPAMLVVMFIGPYSDKRGRRFVIIPPVVGGTLSMLNLWLNAWFQWPIELLLVGNFLYGCTGSWVALFLGCLSFTADVTTKEERHFRIVLVEIISMAPSVLSTAGSGFLVNSVGYTTTFFIMFLLNFLMVLYAIFLVPETVNGDPKAKFFSTNNIKKAITIVFVDDETKRRWKIILLLVALFFCLLVGIGGNVTTLFVTNYPLCWGPALVGIQNAVSLSVAVVGSAITAKIFSCFLRDAWIAVVGGLMNVVQSVYTFFVTTTALMFGASAFKLTYILFTPTLRAMLSKLVQPDEVGAVFSVVALIEGLCSLLGSAIFNPIYSVTQALGHPSLVFLVMGGFYAIGTTIMIIYAVLTRNGYIAKSRNTTVQQSI